MTLTLYYSPLSPPSRSVLLTLMNLGVEFDSKIINLAAGEHKTEAFIKMNPLGKVPTLDDDGFIMGESRAINAYLVNSRSPGSSLYPSDLQARYLVDQRQFYDATVFSPKLTAAVSPIMFGGETVVNIIAKANVLSSLETLESFLDGQDWFSGSEDVSIADLSILASFATLYHVGLDMENFPNIAAWYERCADLPGFGENEKGAKMYATHLKSKLTEPF